MAIYIPRREVIRGQDKPPPDAFIDWSNPINQGLVFFVALTEGAGSPRDLVTGVRQAPAGGTWSRGPFGQKFGGSTKWTNDTRLDFTSNVTCLGFFQRGTTGTNYPNILSKYNYTAEGNNNGYQLLVRANNSPGNANQVSWQVFNNTSSGTYNLDSGSGFTFGTNAVGMACGTYDGATGRIYINGRQTNSKSFSAMRSPTGGVLVGETTNDVCLVFMGAIWNRVLSPAEILSLYESPYQGLSRKRSAIFLPQPQIKPGIVLNAWAEEPPADLVQGGVLLARGFKNAPPQLTALMQVHQVMAEEPPPALLEGGILWHRHIPDPVPQIKPGTVLLASAEEPPPYPGDSLVRHGFKEGLPDRLAPRVLVVSEEPYPSYVDGGVLWKPPIPDPQPQIKPGTVCTASAEEPPPYPGEALARHGFSEAIRLPGRIYTASAEEPPPYPGDLITRHGFLEALAPKVRAIPWFVAAEEPPPYPGEVFYQHGFASSSRAAPPCPYRPARTDAADSRHTHLDVADTRRGQVDSADSRHTRTDTCTR